MHVGQILLDRYTLVAFVGEGGMGVVYRAVDSAGGEVAIKRLHADIAATPGLMDRFQREATAHALLSHPHIAALYAVAASEEGELFFVMELVQGASLAHTFRDGPVPRADAVAIAMQILSALHHAHQFGIVHRDLKPENVLVERRAGALEIKLIDFGLVKMLENVLSPAECERLTTTGMVFGTPAYMPPEQILGKSVDARTDLYSLGIMLFEMVTGRLPYDSDEVSELWDMHLNAPIPSAQPQATPDLDAIVSTLLAKAPDDRFASALAVLRALEATQA
jgi:serine/threonine protein kinase